MINLTQRPLLVPSTETTDKWIREAIVSVHAWLVEHYGVPPTQTRRSAAHPTALWSSSTARWAFAYCFEPEALPNRKYDSAFIQHVFDFVQTGSQNIGATSHLHTILKYATHQEMPPAHAYAHLKRALRAFLILLRARGKLLLPLTFHAGTPRDVIESLLLREEGEVARFFRSYLDPAHARADSQRALSPVARGRLAKYAHRIVWAANWQFIKDVSIEEMEDFAAAIRRPSADDPATQLANSPFPFQLMLSELIQGANEAVAYSQKDLDEYNMWLAHSAIRTQITFREFRANPTAVLNNIQDTRIANNRKRERQRYRTRQGRHASRLPDPEGADEASLRALTGSAADDAITEYFLRLSAQRSVQRGTTSGSDAQSDPLGWLKLQSPYPGRESAIDLPQLACHWWQTMTAFLRYRRKKKGYETDAGPVSALNLLCDYLFLYLPWWLELHPNSSLTVPLVPKEFSRYPFVDHETFGHERPSNTDSHLPKTLLELISVRRKSPGACYSTIVQIAKYFAFVATKYRENNEIAGPGFENPIQREWDLPRNGRRNKTPKVPFSKAVYPRLLFYSYAVEAFGLYLLTQAVDRAITSTLPGELSDPDARNPMRHAVVFDTANCGYVPISIYRNKVYPVFEVPNIFHWAERTFDVGSAGVRDVLRLASAPRLLQIYAPHLSAARMFTGGIELGLRMQHLQWLCRDRWDERNGDTSAPPDTTFSLEREFGQYAFDLLVSVDKTKENAWVTQMTFRLRAMLYREQLFQESISEPDMAHRIWYENRIGSRFGEILSLFRSPSGPDPINDSYYAKKWIAFLQSFERHWNLSESSTRLESSDDWLRFVETVPKIDKRGNPVYVVSGGHRIPEMVSHAISTPHACRVTFATIRQGILEGSVLSALLGHSGPVPTSHYQVAMPEDMKRGLKSSDQFVLRNVDSTLDFDRNNAAHLRPDKPESTFATQARQDRKAAVKDFGLISGRVNLAMSELSESKRDEGFDRFINDPIGQMAFRETHVCSVDEHCPNGIKEKHCGQCWLSISGVDHMPSISAKIHQLVDNATYKHEQCKALAARGEPKSAIDTMWDEMEDDALEAGYWTIKFTLLEKEYRRRVDAGGQFPYLVGAPDIVKRHIQLVVRKSNATDFLLARLAESNAHPSFQTTQTILAAETIRASIITMLGSGHRFAPSNPGDELTNLAHLVKTQIEPRGYSLGDVIARLEEIKRSPALPSQLSIQLSDFATPQSAATGDSLGN